MMRHPVSAPFDPFVAPVTTPVATVRAGDRVAIGGRISDVTVQLWAGGTPALHVTVTDRSGSLTVAFVGRARVAGIARGQRVVFDGAISHRGGRRIMMNPHLWFVAGDESEEEPAIVDHQLAHA